eukprot:CAMPEP_0176081436 /NCGR_PEP_ID=MMETSP0120_2-20121206/40736_1 /TAXON_ID=160619 /ORGANISM="Kryptoperidinium foliaceum, Strain CCMP 1326" /LENGTH=197 /DNA_ID=CAMNT_0017415205 /DNA_START=72 /DNA_END=662 /DNA_ORIENTATION=-
MGLVVSATAGQEDPPGTGPAAEPAAARHPPPRGPDALSAAWLLADPLPTPAECRQDEEHDHEGDESKEQDAHDSVRIEAQHPLGTSRHPMRNRQQCGRTAPRAPRNRSRSRGGIRRLPEAGGRLQGLVAWRYRRDLRQPVPAADLQQHWRSGDDLIEGCQRCPRAPVAEGAQHRERQCQHHQHRPAMTPKTFSGHRR